VPLRILALALSVVLGAVPAAQEQQPQEPPEEDESLIKKEYSFNPLQADKEVQIGNFYFKKGSYRAAAARYLEATKWNEGLAEAWRRLGDAREKLKDDKGAREAYRKYLELEPDGKPAAKVRKKLAGKT
jgi:tetratricopeptide (TPR) repeat protein